MSRLLWIGCCSVVLALVLAACDATPGPAPLDRAAPTVSNLAFAPDTVRIAELPPERVTDGQAAIPFALQVTAQDADGTIDRVVFTVEPSSTPGSTIQDSLQQLEGDTYGIAGELTLNAEQDEIYTFRAFAIDNDQQVSNQVVSSLRVIAPESE